MAITFNVNKTKHGGFGVYVCALSGLALQELRYKLPELSDSEVGGVPVLSGRLKKYSLRKEAENCIKRLKLLPEIELIEIVRPLHLKVIEKNYSLEKLKYFRLNRKFKGENITHFTTQDKAHAEKVALSYAERGIESHLVETVGREILVPTSKRESVIVKGEKKLVIPQGLQGMCKPIKDQNAEFSRRIGQKRKATTKNSFWNKYR